jgi:hypothetical protein
MNDDTDPRPPEPRREPPPDHPPREGRDPIGGTAYPGGGMLPPTGDMDDPIPETGMPGEPKDVESVEELERDPDAGRDRP